MGDNRDESADSRYETWQLGLGGPLPWENLGGRADFITFSYDGSTQILNPLTWLTALRPGRAGINLHPSKTAAAK
jgi:signal peptidase I